MDWPLEDPKVSAPLGSDAGNQLLSSQNFLSQLSTELLEHFHNDLHAKHDAYKVVDKPAVLQCCFASHHQARMVVQGKPLSRVREIREDVKQRVLGLIKQEGWELRPESRHWL